MAAPTPIAIDAPLPPTVKRQYSFTDFSQNNPTTPPLGNRMDAEYDRINVALNTVIRFCSEVKQLTPALTSSQTVAGADLQDLEQDYAVVSQAWAEYMPDTIPPNILAVMNVTGDHWSSRWWANRSAQLVQNWQNALPPGPTNTARYVYVATPGQTVFQGPDRNASTLTFDPLLPQRTQVFKRGLLLTPTDDYNETVANRITLAQPAAVGDIVQVFVFTLPQAFTQPPFTGSGSFTPPTGANYALFVQAAGGATITLGNGHTIGQLVTVKDALGSAGSNPITVAASATIDNNPTYTLYSSFASVSLIWLGALWGTV